MQTKAAVLWEVGGGWQIEDVTLNDPGFGEVLVEMAASGICHSDDHSATGDVAMVLPMVGGHEGAGRVVAVGPGVSRVRIDDHVVLSAVPSCGRCRWCSDGRANLCDERLRVPDQTERQENIRRKVGTTPVAAICRLGTFSDHILASEMQTVPIDRDVPLDVAALIGCAVTTGVLGSTKVAEIRPGDVVVVQGVGGIGITTVQGARIAGATTIVAVDPVAHKRELALSFGATHTAADMDEATALVTELTAGVMADKAILGVGVAHGDQVGPLLDIVGRGGRVVISSIAPVAEQTMSASLFRLAMMDKELRGQLYGRCNPFADMPRLIALYRSGYLKLDEMISTRYRLEDVNRGFADMKSGVNIRGVIEF
jgi:NDMA-dependent alcohol dehydrogenase